MGYFNIPHLLFGHKGQIFKSMPKHLLLEHVADCSLDEIVKFILINIDLLHFLFTSWKNGVYSARWSGLVQLSYYSTFIGMSGQGARSMTRDILKFLNFFHCSGCLESLINLIRIVIDPFEESIFDLQEVTQIIPADLIEFFKSNLVIEMNQSVAVACQGRQQAGLIL
jgi:hypothetical protein